MKTQGSQENLQNLKMKEVGRWLLFQKASQIGHSLLPPFPSSVNMKTNWDGSKIPFCF